MNYTEVAKACNSARNTRDMQDSWENVLSVINEYGKNNFQFAEAAGPGFWNDPDEVSHNIIRRICYSVFK